MITRADHGVSPVPPAAALTSPRWRRIPALAWHTTRAQQSRSRLRLLGYPAALLAWPRTVTLLAHARVTHHLIARGNALLLLVPHEPRPTYSRTPTADGPPQEAATLLYGMIAMAITWIAEKYLRDDIPAGGILAFLSVAALILGGKAVFRIPDTSPRSFSTAARRARAWATTTGHTLTEIWSPGTGTHADRQHLIIAITRYADARTHALITQTHLDYRDARFVPAPHIGAHVLLRPPNPPATPDEDR